MLEEVGSSDMSAEDSMGENRASGSQSRNHFQFLPQREVKGTSKVSEWGLFAVRLTAGSVHSSGEIPTC